MMDRELWRPRGWKGIRPWQRHSLVLMVAGIIYILIGVTYAFGPPSPTRSIALQFAYHWMDPYGWGIIFIVCGLLAILSSRWPPMSVTWGYTALTSLSAAWGAFYGVGILFGTSPPSNVSGLLSWGLLAFMWWAISGLLNPPHKGGVVVSVSEGG